MQLGKYRLGGVAYVLYKTQRQNVQFIDCSIVGIYSNKHTSIISCEVILGDSNIERGTILNFDNKGNILNEQPHVECYLHSLLDIPSPDEERLKLVTSKRHKQFRVLKFLLCLICFVASFYLYGFYCFIAVCLFFIFMGV